MLRVRHPVAGLRRGCVEGYAAQDQFIFQAASHDVPVAAALPLESAVRVDILDAEELLEDLVRRAESREENILTIDGRPAVRLEPALRPLSAEERNARIDAIVAEARANALPGPDAAHCSDFLYDERGLPG